MELSLQRLQKKSKKLKAVYVPLMVALFVPGAQATEAKEKKLEKYGKEAARFVNVTGTVRDSKGEPLPGVVVTIKGTRTSTATDVNGVFRLNLPNGNETLVFSFLGFESKEVKATGTTNITVVLNESTSTLNEVVVVGYGETRRSELVGAVATIKGEELMDIPAPNIAGAMRNRIAGVSVDQVSGRPGSSITLNIRNSTHSDTAPGSTDEPLYIIDGITMPVGDRTFDNLDPSMIESFTFLKDASAAIYGAAGAKGVVLVTTKRGKQGKPSISYNGYMGVSDAARVPDMLSGYELATLLTDTYSLYSNSPTDMFLPEDLAYIKNLNYKSWYDEVWKSSLTQRHNLSVSGGNDKITFFTGGSYQNENGNYKGLQVDRYTFRSGVTATVLEGLKADVAFNVDHNISKANNNNVNNDSRFFESMITVPRWVPISVGGVPVNFNGGAIINPLALLQSGYYNNSKSQGYRINASLTYQPKFLAGLTAKFQVSQAGNNSTSTQYEPPYTIANFKRLGNNGAIYGEEIDPNTTPYDAVRTSNARVVPGLGRGNNYQGFLTLGYTKTFNLHSLNLLVGGEQSRSEEEDLSVYWRNQLIPGSEDFWGFDPNTLTRQSRNIFESTKRSFFGRFNYDFDKKYLIEAVARLDASSNFASGNRWGLAPSVGFAWVMSKENFFKDNVPFVNFLKLKANYGIVGDDRIKARFWQERYEIDTNNGYLFGDNNGNGLNPAAFPNLDITWEKKETINVGLEASLFNNKLDFGVEVFRNKTFDGFDRGANELYPLYAGFLAPVVNYREVYNWGSEFTIGYKAKLATDLNLSASMNFSYGNSVVDRMIYSPGDLVENRAPDWLATSFGTDPRKYNASNIGLIHKGMFRTQDQLDAFLRENPNYTLYGEVPKVGWLYYEDTNNDGIITDLDMVPMYENTNPFFSSGINLNLTYKAFSLSTNIFARFGGKLFYDSRARTKPSNTTNVLSLWKDRWTPQNPMEGRFPRFDDQTIGRNSTYWAVDGTTIRINNMTLSYKVPTEFANKIGLNSARILATGNNLWTIVNPLDYKDPYTSSAYDYPILRTISLGLSVGL